MPIDANQWRASVGLLNASRMPRSLVAMKGTRHLRKRPSQPKSRSARVLTAVLSACVVLLQALWSVVVHVGCLARNLPDVNWWMVQFGRMQRLIQSSKKHSYRTKNKFPSLLDFGSTTLLKVVTVARNAGSRVWKMTEMMNHWKSHTCVSMFGSQPKGVKGLSLLLTSLIVVQMLLIMAGDVELNPGPPKKQGVTSVELKELVTLPISNWRAVGLHLGLHDYTLDRIQADERHQPQHTIHCIGSMFSHWLRDSEEPSYPQVTEALVAARETAAAEQLCSKVGIPLPPERKQLPECVRRYAEYLRIKYRENLPMFPQGEKEWPFSLGSQYIKLALIEHEQKFPSKESSECISNECIFGRVDKILARKRNITVASAFEPVTNASGQQNPLRVLIDGAPGIGKTTLCHKVCKDWAEHKLLTNYDLVVLIELRQIDIARTRSIKDLFYFPSSLSEDSQRYITENHGRNVLVVLDAFDELNVEQRSFFVELISGNLLLECSVVVTSRPYASGCLQKLHSIQRHIEVLGFRKYEVEKCIMRNVSDKRKATELVRHLEEREDLALLCYIPFNCTILIWVYEMGNHTLPETVTDLFSLFILHTLIKHAYRVGINSEFIDKSLDNLPSQLQSAFDDLCKLACAGLMNSKLIFSIKDLEPYLKLDITSAQLNESQLLGLMTTRKSFTVYGEDRIYQFLHLTIQEFLAARWITRCASDELEQISFFKERISEGRFHVTVAFIAGISHLKHPGYKGIFNQPLELPVEVTTQQDRQLIQWFLFLTHLVFESQNLDVCVTLASAFIQKSITLSGIRLTLFNCMTLCHFLLKSGCRWNLCLGDCSLTDESIRTFKTVSSATCKSERKGSVQKLKMFGSRKPIVLRENKFAPAMLLLLPQVPLFDECSTMILDHASIYWEEDSIAQFEQTLSNIWRIKTLKHIGLVGFCSIPSKHGMNDAFARIISKLLTGNTTLTCLDISHNDITSEGAVCIFEALQYNKCMQVLNLSHNHLVRGDCIALMDAVGKALLANKHLKKLDISGCVIEQSKLGRLLLHFLTQNTLPALQELHISVNLRCRLTDPHDLHPSDKLVLHSSPDEFQCLFEFARGVYNPPYPSLHHIKLLDLSRCPLWMNEWMCGVLRDLLLQSTVLETLNLSHCELDDTFARGISAGLKENSSLKSLDISHNEITSEGAVCIFEALQYNKCIQVLNTSHNHLVRGDCIALMDAVQKALLANKHLKKLDISGCKIEQSKLGRLLLHFLTKTTLPALQELHIGDNLRWSPTAPHDLHPSDKLVLHSSPDKFQCLYEFASGVYNPPYPSLHYIKHLDLSRCPLWMDEWMCDVLRDLLLQSTVIETLNLSHCGLDDECAKGISTGLKENSSLKSLDISYNRITSEGAVCMFEALQYKTCLQKLNLSHNHLVRGDCISLMDAVQKALLANKHLKKLDISGCDIKQSKLRPLLLHFLTQNTLPALQELHISVNLRWRPTAPHDLHPSDKLVLHSSPDKFQCLYEFASGVYNPPYPSLHYIKHLDLSRCPLWMDEWMCDVLRDLLLQSTVIETLNLSHCKRDDVFARGISAGLKENSSLKSLDISHNQITSEGAVCMFEGLQHTTCLQELHMSHPNIECQQFAHSHSGVVSFVSALEKALLANKHLETLNLSHCGLDGKFAEKVIMECSSLRSLDISANAITNVSTICILEALQHNTFLQDLTCTIGHVIGQHQIDDDGVGLAIQNMLSMNKHLKSLHLQHEGNLDLRCVASGLASNSVLESLILSQSWQYSGYYGYPLFGDDDDDDYVEALKKNSSLKKFDLQRDNISQFFDDKILHSEDLPVLQRGLQQNFSRRTLGVGRGRSWHMYQNQVQQMADEINKMRAAKGIHPLHVKLV